MTTKYKMQNLYSLNYLEHFGFWIGQIELIQFSHLTLIEIAKQTNRKIH